MTDTVTVVNVLGGGWNFALFFSVIGALVALHGALDVRRKRKREVREQEWKDAEREKSERVELVMSLLHKEEFRERIVDIVISDQRIRANFRDEARSTFIEELATTPAFEDLCHAVEIVRSGMQKIEDIFIQVGVGKIVPRSNPELMQIKKPEEK